MQPRILIYGALIVRLLLSTHPRLTCHYTTGEVFFPIFRLHLSDLSFLVYILVVLLALYPVHSTAVNFSQCLADVIDCANNASSQTCVSMNISNTTAFSLLRTSKGTPVVTTDAATALSYTGCYKHCGKGQEPFSWTGFSQEYSAWLLPYLALLSQLPFGARRRMDNLMSAVLTLGSPTLAGYSLYLTLLNGRWVNDQLFSGVNYPSAAVRQSVVQVLNSLQQVPLRIHPGNFARFESLVVHPDNDNWWITLAAEIDYSHTWSIASATSITWVVIAYLLTVADSLSNVTNNINSSGQGTGSVWLWLLPIVVGWLVLSPKCDYNRVHDAYHKANRQVFVADSHDATAAPTHVTSNFGLTISPSPQWKLYDRNITSPDESRIPPVFNYARTLSWSRTVYATSLFYRAAWRKSSHRIGVDGNHIPGNIRNDVPRESRLGNRSQIIDYCHPDHHEYPGVNVLWPRGMFFNMIVASIMALQLQWATTLAAVLAAWFTPTIVSDFQRRDDPLTQYHHPRDLDAVLSRTCYMGCYLPQFGFYYFHPAYLDTMHIIWTTTCLSLTWKATGNSSRRGPGAVSLYHCKIFNPLTPTQQKPPRSTPTNPQALPHSNTQMPGG